MYKLPRFTLLFTLLLASAPAQAQPPGQGVKMNQIQAMLYYGMTVGTNWEDHWYLLLNDGWGYRNSKVPPADLNVQTSRQQEPDQWFKWKRQGDAYMYLDAKSGQWKKLTARLVQPAKPGQRLSGSYTSYNSASFGSFGGSSSRRKVTFKPDGTYQINASAISGTGAGQAVNGYSGTAAASSSANGCASAQSSSSCGENSGQYVLDGYTLELRSASGKVTRNLFFFFMDKDPNIFIKSSVYLSKEV